MQMELGQMSFADGLVRGLHNYLSEVDKLIDWSAIEATVSDIYSSENGPVDVIQGVSLYNCYRCIIAPISISFNLASPIS